MQLIKKTIQIFTIFLVLGVPLTPIPFYMKLSDSDFERMKYASNPAFIYDTTRYSLSILKSSTRSLLGLLMSPVALVLLPGAIVADTVLLPYDIYLYKRADSIQFWREVVRNRTINDDTSDIDAFDKFYDIYGSYYVGKNINALTVKNFPNYAILHFLLASRHPEYAESKLIIGHIAYSNYATPRFSNELCSITVKDIDHHIDAIEGIFTNRSTPKECINMFYEILMDVNNIEKINQIALLYSLKHRFEYFKDKKRLPFIEERIKDLRQSKNG